MMGYTVKIMESHILDWYDDFVQGLVQLRSDQSWLYCSLIAWDIDSKKKIFALLRLPQVWLDRLKRTLRATSRLSDRNRAWTTMMEVVEQFLEEYDTEVELILCENLEGRILASRRIHVDSVRDDLGGNVEMVIGPSRVERWLSMFSNDDV